MFQSTETGAQPPTVPPAQSSKPQPRREKVTTVIYGSLEACDGQRPAPKGHRMTKHLHTLRFADYHDWSDPIPSGKDFQWMVVLIKHLTIE